MSSRPKKWRCKTCKKEVARRTYHNQPNGMECLYHVSWEEIT